MQDRRLDGSWRRKYSETDVDGVGSLRTQDDNFSLFLSQLFLCIKKEMFSIPIFKKIDQKISDKTPTKGPVSLVLISNR